jgi:DNA-binding MarR family transcriptional regulator
MFGVIVFAPRWSLSRPAYSTSKAFKISGIDSSPRQVEQSAWSGLIATAPHTSTGAFERYEMTGIALEDPIFLGRAVERLSALIEQQSETIFVKRGITIPVKSCSLVSVLARFGASTAADLARKLDVSHQLVLQKLPKLVRLGIISSEPVVDDARKKAFSLTMEGRRQFAQFEQCRPSIEAAYLDLFAEAGDLLKLTSAITIALENRSLELRIHG